MQERSLGWLILWVGAGRLNRLQGHLIFMLNNLQF